MEITPWTTADEVNWSAFLATDTGRRLLPRLFLDVPSPLPGGEINAILIRSGEVRGVRDILQRLLELSRSTKEAGDGAQATDAYPRLEDDKAWQDGQTLNQ